MNKISQIRKPVLHKAGRSATTVLLLRIASNNILDHLLAIMDLKLAI